MVGIRCWKISHDARSQIKTCERTDHEDIPVREIDESQHAIDHRVAKRDERVDGTKGKTVQELLEEFGQSVS